MTAADLAVTRQRQSENTGRLILAITMLLVFIMAARAPLDSDLWWHLRAGEETLRSGRPVLSDSFSYTRFGIAWVNHSWLSQVLLALSYRAGGFLALGLLVALSATASMALIWFQMRGLALLRAFILILACTVAAPVWTPRPQLFSLVLFALTAWMLDRYRARPDRRIAWLLPIFVLWSNLHGGYPLGLMLIAATAAGEGLNHLILSDRAALSWRQIFTLVGVGGVAFLLTALNPNGVQMWLIPFKTVNVGVLQAFIQEWASPDFHDPIQQPFLALLLLSVAALALSKRRADGVDTLRLVLFGGLGLAARRHFGPFALAAAPVLANALAGGFGAIAVPFSASTAGLRIGNKIQRSRQNPNDETVQARRIKTIINLLIVASLGLIAAGKLYSVTHPALIDTQIEQNYPLKAVEWLRANPSAGRIFNAYNWGGYLLWSLPEDPVFVDGRTDLYGDEILNQWITVVQGEAGWEQILEHWQVGLILLEPDRPVVRLLPAAGWKLILQEPGYVFYGR